jgi:AbrB family looped-hinge helix DNA binding protein
MSKITSKLQITVPKVVAEQYGLRPGDEVDWEPAGDAIRLIAVGRTKPAVDIKSRLRVFDQATQRQVERQRSFKKCARRSGRGWTRDELYGCG